jgi:hypothetical protein
LDPVTIAIWLVSFELIILSIFCFDSSVHNSLDSLWLTF